MTHPSNIGATGSGRKTSRRPNTYASLVAGARHLAPQAGALECCCSRGAHARTGIFGA